MGWLIDKTYLAKLPHPSSGRSATRSPKTRKIFYCPPKLKDTQPQPIRDYFHRVERWIGLPALQAAQVRLIEAAPLTKLDLAQTCLDT